ncbi:hypothetical protein [Microbacterium sp. No. 7]|uniref:hypothetical protein n=1 Tax=Microbacterium sp. No. 7 TaxID=1714373 RepID=UPI0006D00A57|nr:hypothetical protein [Microbacterium sp. No. 7]ALJ19567.1 hypothetical protein AOA12_06445 [Microbacterium sp. No. 7]
MSALDEALEAWQVSADMTETERRELGAELGEIGEFSLRQIGAIVGLPWYRIPKNSKTGRTGGRLAAESLPYLVRIRSARLKREIDGEAAFRALALGTSKHTAARLTGVPPTTILRWSDDYERSHQDA